MNKKRKILTTVALIVFMIVVVLIGYGQAQPCGGCESINPMQITRHFGGLTPFGTCLSVLIVIYIALFAMFADKKQEIVRQKKEKSLVAERLRRKSPWELTDLLPDPLCWCEHKQSQHDYGNGCCDTAGCDCHQFRDQEELQGLLEH